MNQKFECIEKHLYKRQYQTASGQWSTLYYVRFKDWKGKHRAFPVGSNLDTAREERTVYEARNIRREDFDADKEEKKQRLTFSEWAQIYFRDKIDPDKRAGGIDREKRSFKNLKPFFGSMDLDEITRSKVMEYRTRRGQDPIVRRGKIVQGKIISFVTINRELAFLRFLLNLAEDDGIIERAPKVKPPSEKDRKRDRIATAEEYTELLSHMRRPAQRVLIGLYETAMRVNELLRLTWEHVDERAGFTRLKAEEPKEKKPRSIPISPALRAILNELKAEQRKVATIANRVFTRQGQPIKSILTAFEFAREKAKIIDLHPHDFRHTAITCWSAMGIPRDIVMAASGHHSIQVHDGYVNIKQNHIKDAFSIVTTLLHEKAVENASAASY